MRSRPALTTLAAAGVLIGTSAAPAFAQPADLTPEALAQHLAEMGSWRFATRDRDSKGQPVCTEIWRFRADGTATVESGAERVTKRWRTAEDDGDRWLYTTSLTTNGAPDCTGGTSDPADYPRPESGLVLMFFNSGIALTCAAPEVVEGPDGKPAKLVSNESCWGSLAPLPGG
jgi:hypothetical protein